MVWLCQGALTFWATERQYFAFYNPLVSKWHLLSTKNKYLNGYTKRRCTKYKLFVNNNLYLVHHSSMYKSRYDATFSRHFLNFLFFIFPTKNRVFVIFLHYLYYSFIVFISIILIFLNISRKKVAWYRHLYILH